MSKQTLKQRKAIYEAGNRFMIEVGAILKPSLWQRIKGWFA